MCRLQTTVVIEHGSLVGQHAVKKSRMGIVYKGQVGQQIDHCRNQHEKGQAEVDRLYRIIWEFLYNLLMLHAVGAFSGMGFGIEVFPVASQQMRKKQQCQSTARIDTGPFAGNSQSHADAA